MDSYDKDMTKVMGVAPEEGISCFSETNPAGVKIDVPRGAHLFTAYPVGGCKNDGLLLPKNKARRVASPRCRRWKVCTKQVLLHNT